MRRKKSYPLISIQKGILKSLDSPRGSPNLVKKKLPTAGMRSPLKMYIMLLLDFWSKVYKPQLAQFE